MNKVILMGRLTRDPDIRYSQEGTAIARFSVAVNRRFVKEKEKDADFFGCVAFGKTAEFAEKYMKQGTKILLAGRIQNNNYTNREGEKVYSVEILVEELEFAESKANQAGGSQKPPAETPGNDGFMNIPDGVQEELPFV